MKNFPQDDECGFHQGSENCFLDFDPYPYQITLNETLMILTNCAASDNTATFVFNRKPVLPGTPVGTLYVNDIAVQTFASQSDGTCSIKTIAKSDIKAEKITISYNSGLLTVHFDNKNVNSHSVSVVSNYEYECKK